MITVFFRGLVHLRGLSGTWEDACISLFLVLFGGLMSGLTLGLMSLDLVELEVLQRSGSPIEQKQAVAVLPVVKKQHQLLVTLVLCNAIAMEALPVFLDNMFSTLVAVILSVTFVLAFGEVIPQAICSRNGLAIGANLGWLVNILMLICFPVAYPIGKLLDLVLGHNTAGLFRRPQLKAFVSIHSKEEGKGGELSHDETTIIKGALDLTLKTVAEAMTPIESTYSISLDTKLDWEALGRILGTGHSRIPVYSGDSKNLIGLLLVKDLISVRAEDETPLSAMCIRKLPCVSADTPLYDLLNEFQKGQSHMAAVTSVADNGSIQTADGEIDFPSSSDHLKDNNEALFFTQDTIDKAVEPDPSKDEWKVNILNEGFQTYCKLDKTSAGIEVKQHTCRRSCAVAPEERNIIGIITLEDVFEELIQEEIVDETDKYVDVHKRIRVATGALPLFSCSSGQDSGVDLSAIGRKLGGRSPNKLKNPSLNGGYDVRQPLLDET